MTEIIFPKEQILSQKLK